ncbi:MAG: hypothetical protein M1133_14265 [Armatimonadetes bacterium]|nr:hypothetical protein [Armatimonadota bacterium]
MKHILIIIAAITAATTTSHTAKLPAKAKSLVILYTSSARGQIRTCNCTKFRFGGYGREFTLVKSVRASSPDVVLIEGGDLTGGSGFQDMLKTDVAAKALKLIGYGAVVPGDEDIRPAAAQAMKRLKAGSVPIVCANLHAVGDPKPMFPSYVVIETKNHLKVGVVGVIDKSLAGSLLEKGSGLTVDDPLPRLKSVIPVVRAKASMVVVIFHGTLTGAEKLAALKGIDLILCTHRGDRDIAFPDKTKDSNEVTLPVEKRGSLVLVKSGTVSNWSLGKLDISLTPGRRIGEVKSTLLYLDRRYPEDPAMVNVYEDYSEKVTTAVLAASKQFKKESETYLLKRGLNPDDMRKRLRKTPYATAEKCKNCHVDIYESWSKTSHASSIASLQKTKQEFDPECISCHATGVLARDGFTNFKETPELANVQCETCHGPGLEHSKLPSTDYGKVEEQTCRACHNDERNPEFDFDAAWLKIKH